MNLLAVIPAYQPDPSLVDLASKLSQSGLRGVLVVNDGSGPDCDAIFSQLARLPKVTVLDHAINLGKGAALKTGINHAACRYPDLLGVVTADADGQHLPDDVLQVARILVENPHALILGVRRFDRRTPWRSRIGNAVTRHALRLLVGCGLRDTQTGLRGIPRRMLPELLRLPSRGYDFELDMLILGRQTRCPIVQTEIRTVYQPGNISSHFNPLLDSLRISFTLLRFFVVALLTALVDYTVFVTVWLLGAPIYRAQIMARFVAMFFNYAAVRNTVFCSGQSHSQVAPRYLLLVVASGVVSYSMILFLLARFTGSVILAKMVAESLVFVANFAIQRDFVFTVPRSRKG